MDIIVYILMSLSSEYDSTKSAIENQPSEHASLQFVVSRLLDAEALLKDRRYNKKGHIARFCDKTVVCHHCGKLSHKKQNCRNLTRKKPPFKEEEAAAVSFVVGEGEVKKFIVDSGTTSHMCCQREWFEELKPSYGTVSCAAKSSLLEVAGIGVICGRLKNGQEIVLTNDNKAIVKGKNKTFVLCELNSKGQYDSDFIPTISNTFVAETEEAELGHRQLGHSGNHALRKIGLPTSDSFCESCVLAKQSAEPIGKGNRRRETSELYFQGPSTDGSAVAFPEETSSQPALREAAIPASAVSSDGKERGLFSDGFPALIAIGRYPEREECLCSSHACTTRHVD
ncbi:hypothetical protein AVEN_267593-1 [Araneus ventricosus]|uniref:Retrovirus-related Pol polyprotein from transposon TNT 1-94-like beta-barrel domain-containing protein n=1 Tax=Araneus ventricosus TaxID=182803 RepID=A0A4Y2N3E2_ARAVE|nr:hypothetical protein AVEN_267593-1 [Araneus ventricosus]